MVRYFVREEAGEFVYLALQLCQLSLHNAMAQIHGAMVRSKCECEVDCTSAHLGFLHSIRIG